MDNGSTSVGLTKGGPGDLILNGANTFTGPITVSAGTLQLGDGLARPRHRAQRQHRQQRRLVVNLNGNQSYAGTISGLGSVTKGGTGTLTLTAAQSYGGPTVITQGTVKLQGGSNIPTAGLLGEWLMNGNAKDSSGNGYNGTPVNNPTFSPNGGQGGAPCLQLSGNGDFVYVNDGTPTQSVFDGGSVMSVSAWVKGWPGTWEAWVSKDGEPAGWQMRRYGSDNQLCFTMRGVSTNDYEGNSTAVSDGNWHMVTMTYDANGGANNESIYIDGVLDAQTTATGTVSAADDFLGFGAKDTSNNGTPNWNSFFACSMDDILFYRAALGAAQVQQIYSASANGGLAAAPSSLLPTTTPLTIASGATLDLAGGNQQVASLSDYTHGSGGSIINSNTAAASVLTISLTGATSTFSGSIGGGALGAVDLVKSGSGTQVVAGSILGSGSVLVDAGTLILSGTDSYTGGTTAAGGTLLITTASALPADQSLVIGGGGTFIFDPTATASAVSGLSSAAVASSGRDGIAAVPEPGTLALLAAAALLGCGVCWRRKRG